MRENVAIRSSHDSRRLSKAWHRWLQIDCGLASRR
jgi:hypothetical protein